MIRYREANPALSGNEVLRRWVRRETSKDEYPDADPSGWGTERLVRELETTYDEPAEAATHGSPAWTAVRIAGIELGKFDVFPACGWQALSEDGTVGGAVDRLEREDLDEEFPSATETIRTFREVYPDRGFGAIVARQSDGDWPPVLLEGNHRACGAHWAAREGTSVELAMHLAHERPLDGLPVEGADER